MESGYLTAELDAATVARELRDTGHDEIANYIEQYGEVKEKVIPIIKEVQRIQSVISENSSEEQEYIPSDIVGVEGLTIPMQTYFSSLQDMVDRDETKRVQSLEVEEPGPIYRIQYTQDPNER
jgi:hypothetical protein